MKAKEVEVIEFHRIENLKNHKIGAMIMDISKAFDCMPHDLLIAKFKVYGVQDRSIEINKSYLSDQIGNSFYRTLASYHLRTWWGHFLQIDLFLGGIERKIQTWHIF